MPPNFLLPESIVKGDGVGPVIDLGQTRGKLLVLTLGITSIVEKESLEVSTWGSEDGESWGTHSLSTFPLKFYCGLYSILLNLAGRPEIRFVRGQWKMSRWSRGDTTPMFGFYLYTELSGSRVTAASPRPSISVTTPLFSGQQPIVAAARWLRSPDPGFIRRPTRILERQLSED